MSVLRNVDLGAGVRAAYSERAGGVSRAPGQLSLNLGLHVHDDPQAVAANRAQVATELGAEPFYLDQVHGADCVPFGGAARADASWTDRPGRVLAIQVADCLPVLFVARDAQGQARAVGAAHAGWRGLAAGVLESTLAALQAPGLHISAWLGPCIGPQAFEVGVEVLQAFGADAAKPGPFFTFRPRADGSPAWLADLQGLAQARLQTRGVADLRIEPAACTFSQPSRFFSFRRDGRISGRFAAFIQLA